MLSYWIIKIVYKKYNVILLHGMTRIIWCLLLYLLFLPFSSHLIFYKFVILSHILSWKSDYSLSLLILYSSLQLYFRLMNHCVFYNSTCESLCCSYQKNKIKNYWCCVFEFPITSTLSLSLSLSLSLLALVWFFFFLVNT